MRTEQLKYLTAVLTILTAGITFLIFADESDLFYFTDTTAIAIGVIVSAYAAFASLYLSRRLEQRRLAKRIFIIYSHKDRDDARSITARLRELGYNPWLDEQEILPGQNWNKTILQAIENSAVALYLASENTQNLESSFLIKEIQLAREILRTRKEEQSAIIPILLEDVELPEELAAIHAVRLYEEGSLENLDRGLKYLLDNDGT